MGTFDAPVMARTRTLFGPAAPVAYDCIKFIVVRHGSAIVLSEFGEVPVSVGDVVGIGANTLCGAEPEGSVTVTILYLDRDYVIDQVFWQHMAHLNDRLAARDLADELYSEPAQILRLGRERVGMLSPWLDELVGLSLDGAPPNRFCRTQALLFAVMDVISPFVKTTGVRHTPTQRIALEPGRLALRKFAPLRAEARVAVHLLRASPARRWTLEDLASTTHLSPSQLARVFVDAYGKTPLAYLTTIRAEHLARLLRETDLPIEKAMRRVGWHSRGHAARMFRQEVGVTPTRYRQLSHAKIAA